VTVVDSRQLSSGTGCASAAGGTSRQGGHTGRILALLDEQIRRTHVFAALDTLEFMRRGGRMNSAIAALGTILQIKPLLKMYDGQSSAERLRTRAGAVRRLKELLSTHAPYERVAVLHSGAEARARSLMEEVHPVLPEGQVWLQEINPVLGTHIGPGVLGFACISKTK
jgi:DegV family protein with EDD domain